MTVFLRDFRVIIMNEYKKFIGTRDLNLRFHAKKARFGKKIAQNLQNEMLFNCQTAA